MVGHNGQASTPVHGGVLTSADTIFEPFRTSDFSDIFNVGIDIKIAKLTH